MNPSLSGSALRPARLAEGDFGLGVARDAIFVPESTSGPTHLDMNCALPECEALKFFWDRISPGGIVLFDDYAYFGYEAQGSALDSVARSLGASILALPTGQGMILK